MVWVNDVGKQGQVGSDLREQIKRLFDAEGGEIPFPQRVVRTARDSAPAP